MHLTVDPFVRDSGGLASLRFAYMNFQAFSGYGMLSCGLTWQHACMSGRWLAAILKQPASTKHSQETACLLTLRLTASEPPSRSLS